MDELDEYGRFNTRYEGVGRLLHIQASVDVHFEVRQLFDGRLLIGCVAPAPIPPNAICIEGYLLSGEPFSTIWGQGLTEIHRTEQPSKVHYSATMTRVRYTKDLEPNSHSIQFALHNFIPGPNTDVSRDRIELRIRGMRFTLTPVGNYKDQASSLCRQGGNLRTSWATVSLVSESGERVCVSERPEVTLREALFPISLALGTRVTSPQSITFDSQGNRNDVEHYASMQSPFSTFICSHQWDSSVAETVEAWFHDRRDRLLSLDDIRVLIFQHLDACSTDIFLETRALAAASLLDVLAGRYLSKWKPNAKPQEVSFREKLKRLLNDLQIALTPNQMKDVIAARNSLVHAGKFVTSTQESGYHAFEQLLLLGRVILLRLVGVSTSLHQVVFQ